MMQGKLIIFSAPSGAGKTTLVNFLLTRDLKIAFSVSATSRKKRPYEVEGKDYYFISADEFKEKIKNDEFLEWEEVYRDHYYGTLKSEIERIWSVGLNVILDVDVKGGLNIKKKYGGRALSVFIMPPSVKELEKRLIKRSTESIGKLKGRIAKAEAELKHAGEFDVIIINDNLEKAKRETLVTVTGFLKQPYQSS